LKNRDAVPGVDAVSSSLISVIVPTLNEAGRVSTVLASVQAAKNIEVIFVDGGSDDGTPEQVIRHGARVIDAPRGRAKQMNAGAAIAKGQILVFVHADTILPSEWDHHVRRELIRPGIVAGAFKLRIDGKAWGLRWIEALANLRSRILQMPYGDQAIFLRAETFHELGGFPELPVMEDFAFVRFLGSRGRISIVPVPVVTSSRRWDKLGICRTAATNQIMVVGYLLGLSTDRLAGYYRR
jgi:rSAM/selenodomain-associated transferase 2